MRNMLTSFAGLLALAFTVSSHSLPAETSSWSPQDQAYWWQGEQYNKNSSLQQRWAYGFLGRHEFQSDERVLDVGCRDGKIAATIAQAVPRGYVTGVDAAPSMIEFASENFATANLSFELADLTALPFSEEFDLVVSFNSLLWVRDQPAALKSIYNALRPGGELKIILPIKAPEWFTRSLDTLVECDEWAGYFEGFVPSWRHQKGWGNTEAWRHEPVSGYTALLSEAGLTLQRVEKVQKADAFEDKDSFLGFVKVITPHLRQLPEDLKDSFIQQWYALYIKHVPLDSDGHVWWHATVLEVEATRDF